MSTPSPIPETRSISDQIILAALAVLKALAAKRASETAKDAAA